VPGLRGKDHPQRGVRAAGEPQLKTLYACIEVSTDTVSCVCISTGVVSHRQTIL